MDGPRRSTRLKAAESAAESAAATPNDSVDVSGDLLGTACMPLTSQDIQDWKGWIELESEPAFFNAILQDLGVQDVEVKEILAIDQIPSDEVPKPVLGLIFLFLYEPDHEKEVEEPDPPDHIWFANQTTNNACATVALLNIIMNATDVDLGPRLTEFKNNTKDLSTALRGHSISSNSFIRSIHNAFSRRMDHLNADLCLENDMQEAELSKTRKGGKGRGKKRKDNVEYGFHFIAYVPVDDNVWELDGLESNPHKLGPILSNDWTALARQKIETRMLLYEESQLSFSLLAVCCSPLRQHKRQIATMAAAVRTIREQMKNSDDFNECVSGEEPLLDLDNQTQLAEFDLSQADVRNAEVPAELQPDDSDSPRWKVHEACDMYQTYQSQLKAAMDDFRVNSVSVQEDQHRVRGRRRDYGGALHCWLKKLAQKAVLEDIIKALP